MEVNQSYIEFLLQLLSSKENIEIEPYKQELIVNLYLTLLSLSNLEYSEDIDQKENEIISDFLRKLNNLKVKIQLKRKPEETNRLAQELITQYYENANILSIYIHDGIELENTINTMDAKSLTRLIDFVTKDKMNKEDSKEERNKKRLALIKLIPTNKYYITGKNIYISNDDNYEELTIEEFIEMFNYLLNPDNYRKTYSNSSNQRAHELIVANIIRLLMTKERNPKDIDKIIIPVILTHILSLDIDEEIDLDMRAFNIENIKITELYSFASQNQNQANTNFKTAKGMNISIPNKYLIEKLKEMIKNGMYYYKEDTFVLENIKDNTSDFKVSIKIEKIKEFLQTILEATIQKYKTNSKKK